MYIIVSLYHTDFGVEYFSRITRTVNIYKRFQGNGSVMWSMRGASKGAPFQTYFMYKLQFWYNLKQMYLRSFLEVKEKRT